MKTLSLARETLMARLEVWPLLTGRGVRPSDTSETEVRGERVLRKQLEIRFEMTRSEQRYGIRLPDLQCGLAR